MEKIRTGRILLFVKFYRGEKVAGPLKGRRISFTESQDPKSAYNHIIIYEKKKEKKRTMSHSQSH